MKHLMLLLIAVAALRELSGAAVLRHRNRFCCLSMPWICHSMRRVCDGIPHCQDSSDENNCRIHVPVGEITKNSTSGPAEQLRSTSSGQVVPSAGINFSRKTFCCPYTDGSLEDHEIEVPTRCISWRKICDGKADCKPASKDSGSVAPDEQNCERYANSFGQVTEKSSNAGVVRNKKSRVRTSLRNNRTANSPSRSRHYLLPTVGRTVNRQLDTSDQTIRSDDTDSGQEIPRLGLFTGGQQNSGGNSTPPLRRTVTALVESAAAKSLSSETTTTAASLQIATEIPNTNPSFGNVSPILRRGSIFPPRNLDYFVGSYSPRSQDTVGNQSFAFMDDRTDYRIDDPELAHILKKSNESVLWNYVMRKFSANPNRNFSAMPSDSRDTSAMISTAENTTQLQSVMLDEIDPEQVEDEDGGNDDDQEEDEEPGEVLASANLIHHPESLDVRNQTYQSDVAESNGQPRSTNATAAILTEITPTVRPVIWKDPTSENLSWPVPITTTSTPTFDAWKQTVIGTTLSSTESITTLPLTSATSITTPARNISAVWPTTLYDNETIHTDRLNGTSPTDILNGQSEKTQGPYWREFLGQRADLCNNLDGNFPAPHCLYYVICRHNYATAAKCPAGFVFNPAIGHCDWPLRVPSCLQLIL